jgi:toxin ParE1/3/4
MSARRLRLELAPRAQRDLLGIRLYTVEQWGEDQADTYLAALNKCFETLRDHPRIGVTRDDLRPGLRSFAVEQHLILYRIGGEAIYVLRVVHGRQDLSRQRI